MLVSPFRRASSFAAAIALVEWASLAVLTPVLTGQSIGGTYMIASSYATVLRSLRRSLEPLGHGGPVGPLHHTKFHRVYSLAEMAP